jgi:hypothetical protein
MSIVIQELAWVFDADSQSDNSTESSRTQNPDVAYFQWSPEFLFLLFTTAIFVAICLSLDHYHDEELPDWNELGITLITLISIPATVFRSLIGFIGFEMIAQLKWEWLSLSFRPLLHVQLSDGASRGVYGSLRLLPVIAFELCFSLATQGLPCNGRYGVKGLGSHSHRA